MPKYFSKSLMGLFLTIAALQLVPVSSERNRGPFIVEADYSHLDSPKKFNPISMSGRTMLSSNYDGEVLQKYLKIHLDGVNKHKIIRLVEGDQYTIQCDIAGNPRPKVFMSLDSKGIEKVEPTKSHINSSLWGYTDTFITAANVTTKYVIDCATKKDERVIYCVGDTGIDAGYLMATIIVEENERGARSCEQKYSPPVITHSTQTIFGYIGESSLTIPCLSNDVGKFRTAWSFNNEPIYSGKKYIIMKNGSLKFRQLVKFDSMGAYRCTVGPQWAQDSAETFLYPADPVVKFQRN